jgi:hypothetical protein
MNVSLEVLNTRLPPEAKLERSCLKKLNEIPKMSTYAIGAMVNYGVSCMPSGTCFLNVGVWHGFSFLSGIVGNNDKKCIGVDNFSGFGGPKDQFIERFNRYKGSNHHFYEKTFSDYFSEVHDDPIGFYLYDADHNYRDQLFALQVAEPFFSKNCVILIDDINWKDPRKATLDFVDTSQNKYQILQDFRTPINGHPTFWNGIMVLQRVD